MELWTFRGKYQFHVLICVDVVAVSVPVGVPMNMSVSMVVVAVYVPVVVSVVVSVGVSVSVSIVVGVSVSMRIAVVAYNFVDACVARMSVVVAGMMSIARVMSMSIT